MLILALDTTTRAGSIALARDGVVLHARSGDPARTHGQRLPGELIDACAAAGVEMRAIELLGVAAGPGSFTGLRIGIAAVQGLAMAWNRNVVPVSTLEALARSAPPDRTTIAAWMDAQRGQVYAQVFRREDGRVRPLTGALAGTPAEALAAHAASLRDAFFIGDGAARYATDVLAHTGDPASGRSAVPPLAPAIAQIAYEEPGRAVRPHGVVPVYVRRPDAELARDARAGQT